MHRTTGNLDSKLLPNTLHPAPQIQISAPPSHESLAEPTDHLVSIPLKGSISLPPRRGPGVSGRHVVKPGKSVLLEPPPGAVYRHGTGFRAVRPPPTFLASSIRSLPGPFFQSLWPASSSGAPPLPCCTAVKTGWEAPGSQVAHVPILQMRVYSWRPREGKGHR